MFLLLHMVLALLALVAGMHLLNMAKEVPLASALASALALARASALASSLAAAAHTLPSGMSALGVEVVAAS